MKAHAMFHLFVKMYQKSKYFYINQGKKHRQKPLQPNKTRINTQFPNFALEINRNSYSPIISEIVNTYYKLIIYLLT